MFDIQRSGEETILTVWENLDVGSQADFERVLGAVAAGAPRRVVVSLAHCAYCDSTGLNVLLRWARATRLGSRLTVVVAPDTLSRRVFEACRMQKLVRVVASMREALSEPPRGSGWGLPGFGRLPHYS